MSASLDTAGFKLFTELYRKKRVKDGRRELPKKQFEEKISAHWKALTADKHKRYNQEAIRRLTRTPVKKRYVSYSARHVPTKRRARSVSPQPRKSKKSYRSRSPIRSHKDHSRSRSWSASSARTEYLGRQSDYSDSSYTDTASTYYDEDDDCSDATSCSSIASSYDDLTETTHNYDPKPTTSAKPVKRTKPKIPRKVAARKVQKTPRTKVENKKKIPKTPKKRATKLAAKKSLNEIPNAATGELKKRGKPHTKRVQRTRKPRAVTAKKVVPLRKTRASLRINVKNLSDASSLPHQVPSDAKLKTSSVGADSRTDMEQANTQTTL